MAYCASTNRFGDPCRMPALKDDEHCYIHSDRTKEKRRKSRQRGARLANAAPPHSGKPPESDPATLEGLQDLLRYTVAELLLQPNSNARAKALLEAVNKGTALFQLGDDVAALRAFVEAEQQRKGQG